jgi:hypothetical protein
MRRRLRLASLVAGTMLVTATLAGTTAANASVQAPTGPTATTATASLAGRPTPPNECSTTSFRNDPLLGPAELPTIGVVAREVRAYRRTGFYPPNLFLARYTDPVTGKYVFPPYNGFAVGPYDRPIIHVQNLLPGARIDRYGAETGAFLAPFGAAYGSRAIPPSNLGNNGAFTCNYHAYRVLKRFGVLAGPAAPWFAQPGGGIQYVLDRTLVTDPSLLPTDIFNVGWLVSHGYLTPIPVLI